MHWGGGGGKKKKKKKEEEEEEQPSKLKNSAWNIFVICGVVG